MNAAILSLICGDAQRANPQVTLPASSTAPPISQVPKPPDTENATAAVTRAIPNTQQTNIPSVCTVTDGFGFANEYDTIVLARSRQTWCPNSGSGTHLLEAPLRLRQNRRKPATVKSLFTIQAAEQQEDSDTSEVTRWRPIRPAKRLMPAGTDSFRQSIRWQVAHHHS